MTEKKRKTIVFAILIVAVIWGYFSLSDRFRATGDKQIEPLPTAQPAAGFASPIPTISTGEMFADIEKREWGDDPFFHNRLRQPQVSSRVRLHLLGILYRSANARALINGTIVAVGDDIAGYRVSEITSDYVRLIRGGQTVTLRPQKEAS